MNRKRQIVLWLISALLLQPLCASTKVLVTVVEQKSGKPVTGLQPYLGAMGHLTVVSKDGKQYVTVAAGNSLFAFALRQ